MLSVLALVTLGKSLNLFVPQRLHTDNGKNVLNYRVAMETKGHSRVKVLRTCRQPQTSGGFMLLLEHVVLGPVPSLPS